MTDICVWQMGSECDGEVKRTSMFNLQLKVSICEKHLKEHLVIMDLHNFDMDMDLLLQMNEDDREFIHNCFTDIQDGFCSL